MIVNLKLVNIQVFISLGLLQEKYIIEMNTNMNNEQLKNINT